MNARQKIQHLDEIANLDSDYGDRDVFRFKEQLRSKDFITRDERDAALSGIKDPEELYAAKQLYEEHKHRYKKNNPLKAWAKYHVSDVAGPIKRALPKKFQKYLESAHDYGESGGLVGTIASMVLDPTSYVPVAGLLSRAARGRKIVNVIKESARHSPVIAGAIGGGAYGALKEYGNEELREDKGSSDMLGATLQGGAIGGAAGKIASKVAEKIGSSVGASKLSKEELLRMSKDELKELDKTARKKAASLLEKDVQKTQETLKKISSKAGSGNAAKLKDGIEQLYKGKKEEFSSLYKSLEDDFAQSTIDSKVFQGFSKEIGSIDKITNGSMKSKESYSIKDMNNIKRFMEDGVSSEINSELKRLKLGRKQNFEETMNKAISESHPELKEAIDKINSKYKTEFAPIRNHRPAKLAGEGKVSEVDLGLIKGRSGSTNQFIDAAGDDVKQKIINMISEKNNYNPRQIAKFISKIPEKTGKQLFGAEYDSIASHPMMLDVLKAVKPAEETSQSFIKAVKYVARKLF